MNAALRYLTALSLALSPLFFACSLALADETTEVPGNAVENYLSDDLKRVPDGAYIPYPEEVEEFKNSPLYKFFEQLGPETDVSPAPSGGGCKVDKKFLESV